MAAAPQTYYERRPAPVLARHLTSVWVQEVAADAPAYTHVTIPNGSADLVCVVGSLPQLVGPQTGPVEETLAPGTTVVGVRFRPGALPALVGMPATELLDVSVDAGELWDAVDALGERVAAAATPQDAAAVVERAVMQRVVSASDPDPIAAEAVRRLRPWVASDVTGLPPALHISERQLRRRVEAATGLPPKVLHRMLRFQGFLALAHQHAQMRGALARLAAEAGFADQSHLTRESLRLAGRSPAALLLEAEEHCAPAHDHAASYEPLLRRRAAA